MITLTLWNMLLFFCLPIVCLGASWRKEARSSQACGDRLADIMSLVCSGRGYNVAFRPEHSNARRFRRGIVEECCRKSCTPEMLELYCQPTEDPSNVQIRKRSDSGVESGEAETSSQSTSRENALNTLTRESETESRNTPTNTMKEGKQNYNLINFLSRKQNIKSSLNKLMPNDTMEDEQNKPNSIPPMRHKNHHHGSRQLRGRKLSTKTKREKITSEETFKIGVVKPYFAGRALAAPRSHHSVLSS